MIRRRSWLRLVPALGLVTAAGAAFYACSERPRELTGPRFEVGPGGGWDLNHDNTPTTTNPDTVQVTSLAGYVGQWIFPTKFKVGTGLINPFLRVQKNGSEEGFNTSASGSPPYDDKPGTTALALNHVPIVKGPGGFGYREFILDADENTGDWRISIDKFDVWVCDDNGANLYTTFAQFENNALHKCKRVYDLGGQVGFATDSLTRGSGKTLDYDILVPEQAFTDSFPDAETKCPYQGVIATACGYWLIVRTQMGAFGGSWTTDGGFEEFSTIIRPFVSVSKVAHTSYTRTFRWEITKSATPTSHVLFNGESDSSYYTVTVDTTGHLDSAFLVIDTVRISNPSGSSVVLDSVTDKMGPVAVTFSCGVSFPYTLPNGSTLVCTSSAHPADGSARQDTATAYLPDSVGGSAFRGFADVTFGAPTRVVNDSVNVTDSFKGTLGFSKGSSTFNYYRPFTCDADTGAHKNIAAIVETGQKDSATVTVACANLTVTKDASTELTRTWHWTIDKSVNPDNWDLFVNDSAISKYTVAVDRTDSTDSAFKVTGNITVKNPGGVNIHLDSLVDYINTTKATVDCSGSTFPDVAAGDSIKCTYSASLPDGTTQSNQATAWVGTHSFSGTKSVDFSNAKVDSVDAKVDVQDNFDGGGYTGLGTGIGKDSTFTFNQAFGCLSVGTHEYHNTARITTHPEQTDTATVTVTCYQLNVTKSASDSLTRTWAWKIAKVIDASKFLAGTFDASADPPTATIGENEDLTVFYNVTVDTTGSEDSDRRVFGTITIKNPNPTLGAEVTVSDLVDPDIVASLDCGGGAGSSFQDTIPKADSLKCTYTASLPDETSRTDTAKAKLQNYYYLSDGTRNKSGTTTFTGTATSNFASALIKQVDACVVLWDIFAHGQGGAQIDSTDLNGGNPYCITDKLDTTFVVTKTFGPNGDNQVACDDNFFDNTGWLKTVDLGVTADSTASINIHVDCVKGCTLTLGYWKTHNFTFDSVKAGNGPPPDTVWSLLDAPYFDGTAWHDGDGNFQKEKEPFFLSGQTWFEVFQTKPQGNAYYILADQYMAAVLNGLGGADQSAVSSALAQAKTLFETYTPAQVAAMKGNNSVRQLFLSLANTLDQYNQGIIGPGHCTENVPI